MISHAYTTNERLYTLMKIREIVDRKRSFQFYFQNHAKCTGIILVDFEKEEVSQNGL